MNWYIMVSGIVFALLWLIWSSKTWLNTIIKIVFFVLTAWSAVLNFQAFGWIVKGPL